MADDDDGAYPKCYTFGRRQGGAHARDGSERSMASNRWQRPRTAAPAPSPSHSADATCRPRFQPLKNRRRGSGRRRRSASQGLTPVRLPQQLHHSHWRRGEMPADERINSAVSRARQRGLTSTTSTVAACRACASSLPLGPANRACSRPWSLSGASKNARVCMNKAESLRVCSGSSPFPAP